MKLHGASFGHQYGPNDIAKNLYRIILVLNALDQPFGLLGDTAIQDGDLQFFARLYFAEETADSCFYLSISYRIYYNHFK